MFGSQLLDIAIGIVFIFLLFSLICSGANELLSSLVNARGAFLKRGLQELLNDKGAADGLLQTFYNHGLIYGLYRDDYDPAKSNNLPTYIPARSFALALMDIFPKLPEAIQAAAADSPEKSVIVSGAQGATSSRPLKDVDVSAIQSFRDAVASYPDPKLRQSLLTLIDSANGDAVRVRQNLEELYNNTMGRVSGWYKKRSQWILLALGLCVAVGFNADTIAMTKLLSNDMVLRQSLVAAAQERAKSHSAAQATEDLKQDVRSVDDLGLPVGWLPKGDPDRVLPPWWNGFPAFFSGWVELVRVHLAGWLLTAVAISLGAPFWFDLLNRFMVVRSTVKPDEKTQTERSKD